jgi:hypothetical protein
MALVEAIIGNLNHLSKFESLDYSCEALISHQQPLKSIETATIQEPFQDFA